MTERQPDRPTETQFDGAVLRFIENNYCYNAEPMSDTEKKRMKRWLSMGSAMCLNSIVVPQDVFDELNRKEPVTRVDVHALHHDRAIIDRERRAEGLKGTFESLTDFALARYAEIAKTKKPEDS